MSQPDARTHARDGRDASVAIDDTWAAVTSAQSTSWGPMALTLAAVLLLGTLGLLFSPAQTGAAGAWRVTVSSSRHVDAVVGFSTSGVSGGASSSRVGGSTAFTSGDRS